MDDRESIMPKMARPGQKEQAKAFGDPYGHTKGKGAEQVATSAFTFREPHISSLHCFLFFLYYTGYFQR